MRGRAVADGRNGQAGSTDPRAPAAPEGGPQGGREEQPAAALARVGRENLVSLLLVASGDIAADRAELARLADHAAARFDFHEIVVAAARPGPDWRRAMAAETGRVAHLRIVTIDLAMDYEELAAAALRFPIGDLVASLWPGEVGPAELDRMLGLCAAGGHDLVRARHAPEAARPADRLADRLGRFGLRLAAGHETVAFPARAVVLTRAALTRIETAGGALRFFRVLALPDRLAAGGVLLPTPPRRPLLGTLGRRLRLAALVVSSAAPRLVLGLALLCLALCLGSAGYTLYALLAWAVLPDIAPGWTSTSVVLSLFFCANFAVLGVLCLGLLRLLGQGAGDPVAAHAAETGGGDLFGRGDRLNVESGEGR